MTFPAVLDTVATVVSTNGTSHVINLPTNLQVGELLVLLFASRSNGGATISAGWHAIDHDTATDLQMIPFLHQVDGTEGTTVTVTTSGSVKSASHVFRIGPWRKGTILDHPNAWSAEGYFTWGATAAPSVSPNPPSADPTLWDSEDVLWIATYAAAGAAAVSAYPTTYLGGLYTQSDAVADSVSIGSAWNQKDIDIEDPGTFTIASSLQWLTATVAIRGPATNTATIMRTRAQKFNE